MNCVETRYSNYLRVREAKNSSSRSLINVPKEIVEKIVFFCDGVTIKRLSAVNKLFNEAVVNQSKHNDLWKKCCDTEIGKSIVYELSRYNFGPREWLVNDSYLDDFYYKIYVKWYRSLNVGKWASTDTPIDGFFQNPVTCIKATGDLVIMGHKDGCVSICDHLSQNIQIACRHIRMVTDIALVDLAGRDLYRIYESKEGAISHHHHIISVSKDQTIQVYPIQPFSKIHQESRVTIKPSSYELKYVRVFGDYCAVYSRSLQISLWKMSLPTPGVVNGYEPLVFTHITYVNCPETLPGWFNLWENKIRTLCPNSLILSETHLSNLDDFSSRVLKPPALLMRNKNARQQYISLVVMLRENVTIIVTVGGVLYYSIGNGNLEEFPIYKHFTSRVTSIALWGGILAVGLECGELVIYRCPKVNDLATLHRQKPVYRRRLHPDRGNGAIVALDIDDNGKGPVVVASLTEAISVLQWCPSY